MEKKFLPMNIQDFRYVREEGLYYVDKTEYIHQLTREKHKHFFLSRPRRFGKSLFVSTLMEAFEGNEELFRGLALHDKWDWSTRCPIIHLDFATAKYSIPGKLDGIIDFLFSNIEDQVGLTVETQNPETRLKRLIDHMHSQTGQPVVLLIDEYDKPILDALHDQQLATVNRDILHGLYGVTKPFESNIRFSFFTGVSRFSKTSLFSGASNIEDITMQSKYSSICGYTEADLDSVFAPEIVGLDRDKIRDWYNGYNWLGEERVYNPCDILGLLNERIFEPWWFKTGHPSFLTKTLKDKRVMSVKISDMRPRSSLLESFDVDEIEPETLLFQAGYLTIAEKIEGVEGISYRLDYPNRELRQNLNILLLEILFPYNLEDILRKRESLLEHLRSCNREELKTLFQSVLAGLPKQWHTPVDLTKYEAYFASVFYSFFSGAGLRVRAEDATDKERIDLVVEGPSYVYIFEFKMVNGKENGEALKQILNMQYAQKYRETDNPLYLAGVEISKETHNIVKFEVIEDDGSDPSEQHNI